jgi:hypothetical protein
MNNNLSNPSESSGARPVSEDDFHTKQPHPCSLLGPSIEEQIEVIQDTIDILRRGNTLSRSDAGDPSHPRTGRQGTIKAAARRMTPSWGFGEQRNRKPA